MAERKHSALIDGEKWNSEFENGDYDFVNRSKAASIFSLQGYHYRLDGYYMKRSANSINNRLAEETSEEKRKR